MRRVVVIGAGGSGKSTFSRRLGAATGLPVVHLDRLFWKPNWVPTPRDEWIEIVRRETERDAWIMDGNFGSTRAMRLAAADTIIMLDLPRWLCMYRIAKRMVVYRYRTRPDMAEGCRERLDTEFVSWVWNYRKTRRDRVLQEVADLEGKRVHILSSRHAIRDFLARATRSDR